MADDDDYYYYEDDAFNDYGEAEETWETPLQVKYDDAKAVIDADPAESIRLLQEVMEEDTQRGLWTFKCLKKLARASRNARQYDAMLDYQQQFMTFQSPEVDDTLRMKAMTKFIDKISRVPREYQSRAIDATVREAEKNMAVCGRLWLNSMLRKATGLVDEGEDAAAIEVLTEAHRWCEPAHVAGNEPQLCAVFSLLLRACNKTRQFARAREVYFAAMALDTANGAPVPQRTLASVLEWGGHMYLRDADWHAAYRAFNMAFRFYSDCGDGQAVAALKFAVVADMLCGSPIDAFAANESKAGAEAPDVQPIVRLLNAFAKNDVAGAVALMQDPAHAAVFVADELLAPYVEPLLFRLRLNTLIQYVASFTTVTLADVARRLCLKSVAEAAELCTFAILQQLIVASVDDAAGMLRVESTATSTEMRRSEALLLWSSSLTQPSR